MSSVKLINRSYYCASWLVDRLPIHMSSGTWTGPSYCRLEGLRRHPSRYISGSNNNSICTSRRKKRDGKMLGAIMTLPISQINLSAATTGLQLWAWNSLLTSRRRRPMACSLWETLPASRQWVTFIGVPPTYTWELWITVTHPPWPVMVPSVPAVAAAPFGRHLICSPTVGCCTANDFNFT